MINWNTDTITFKKNDPQGFELWKLTQQINYGLWGDKLSKKLLMDKWEVIKDNLDLGYRKTLEFYLWGKRWTKEPGLRTDRKNFWQWFLKKRISKINSTSRAEQHFLRSIITTAILKT